MKKLMISLFLISLFAISSIHAMEHEDEAITLFNPLPVEMRF